MTRAKAGPDPVSCQSCRIRKLRCSRKSPCSNCVARHIPCNFSTTAQRSRIPLNPATHDAQILNRLEVLEGLILPANVAEPGHSKSRLRSSKHATPEAREASDLQELENIGTGLNSAVHNFHYPSRSLSFTTGSIEDILLHQRHPEQQATKSHQPHNVIILPSYDVAVLLFQNYVADANHVCRIIHAPTVGSKMRTFYLSILQKASISLGEAALFLSIFALSMYFYRPSIRPEITKTQEDATFLSQLWGNQALDVLDHSIRATGGNIEDVQAYILMSYHIYHFEGFSARQRFLSTAALAIARDLRLHRLDLDVDEDLTDMHVFIDNEVKRRVFWHLASTEWLNSTISGPQEGTYLLSLNQIDTKTPRNYADDCMFVETSDSNPEGMVFFLKRLEIAHICREMTDTLPIRTDKLMQIPYEHVLAMDKKLMEILARLPKFLCSDHKSSEESTALEIIYPKIPVMRYYINTTAHSRRCRLHQKYLLRQGTNPEFAYSRQAALESACAIIKAFDLGPSTNSAVASTTRMGTAIHITQLAMVTIVTDLCFNKHLPCHGAMKREVEVCLRLLGTFRGTSTMLDRSLDLLDQFLRKQGIGAPGLGNSNTTDEISPATGPFPLGQESQILRANVEYCGANASPICDFWQAVDRNVMDADISAWDSLFAALDSEPI